MASTLTTRRVRIKARRAVRLLLALVEGGTGVIRLTVGTRAADYLVRKIGSDWGDGFRLDKIGHAESYDVHLSDQGHTCECLGWLRHGRCKHVGGLVALRKAGRL